MNRWTYGCPARFFNSYEREIEFARREGFEFVQIWYDDKGIKLHPDDTPALSTLQRHPYPAILHAVLDVESIPTHTENLSTTLRALGHKELILHPTCKKERFSPAMNAVLGRHLAELHATLSPEGVRIFVENNSRLDPIFSRPEDVEAVLGGTPGLGFLFDVAHPTSFEEIERWVEARQPDMLHVADRRCSVVHEHLPIGRGEINFEAVFSGPLSKFLGKIVFEVIESDEALISARNAFESLRTQLSA